MQIEILEVFHNVSNYDYHFMSQEFVKEFEEQFECLGENTVKEIKFYVPIKKEHVNSKTIS